MASPPPLRSLVLPLLALVSIALTALHIVDIVRTNSLSSNCEMTYSWPVYTLQTLPSKELPPHRKYSLYRVDMQEARQKLTGVPVLFVPGHMGSYKQARSIARHLWDIDSRRFDVFAVDFGEEYTGLHGKFIDEQAQYVNDAVRAILKQYQKQNRQKTAGKKTRSTTSSPESVVIIAHSMGGVVVRVAELLPNYKRNSIQHVVALGTPFEKPPFPFDTDAHATYSRVASASTSKTSATYVSISGGHKDTTIDAALALTDRIRSPAAKEIVLLSSKMPGVERTIDHLCLVWCHELLKRVALSIDAIVDRETKDLIQDEDERIQRTRTHFLVGGSGSSNHDEDMVDALGTLHRQALVDGYHSADEFASYGLLLPRFIVRLVRARGISLSWVMYLIAVHIFHLQLAHWQRRFDLQAEPPSSTGDSAANAATLSQEHFPSFTSLLHPAAHAPGIIKTAIAVVDSKLTSLYGSKRTTFIGGIVTAAVVLLGVLVELSRRYPAVFNVTSEVLQLGILYAVALGYLYTLSLLLSAVRVVAQPLVRVTRAIARRARAKRWFIISVVFLIVQLLGHVRDFELLSLDSVPRHLALLVLGSTTVFLLHVVELGLKLDNLTADQQRYRATLVAIFTLSLQPWVGKLVYYFDIVQNPPAQMTNDLLLSASLSISTLALYRYFITVTDSEMAPLPPTAFFDNADGDDADAGEGKVKITAENCPRCVFEDGGPGAVFIEYENQSTTHRYRSKKNELVIVGSTFRVVSCDCVFRFKTTREYCEFCTRSCRLCGGGSGNYAQAQKYREFLDQAKTEVALHGLVALSMELIVLVLLAMHKEHLIAYTTPTVVLILTLYHGMLRNPIEAAKLKKELRKRQKKDDIASGVAKKKPKKKSASSRRRTSQNKPASNSSTSKTKDTASAPMSSLMEEYGGSEVIQ